jgi:hypothetical protein
VACGRESSATAESACPYPLRAFSFFSNPEARSIPTSFVMPESPCAKEEALTPPFPNDCSSASLNPDVLFIQSPPKSASLIPPCAVLSLFSASATSAAPPDARSPADANAAPRARTPTARPPPFPTIPAAPRPETPSFVSSARKAMTLGTARSAAPPTRAPAPARAVSPTAAPCTGPGIPEITWTALVAPCTMPRKPPSADVPALIRPVSKEEESFVRSPWRESIFPAAWIAAKPCASTSFVHFRMPAEPSSKRTFAARIASVPKIVDMAKSFSACDASLNPFWSCPASCAIPTK